MTASVHQLPVRCPHGSDCLLCAVGALREQRPARTDDVPVPLLLSFELAAEQLGVSWDTVAQLVRDGELEFVEGVGRGRKVPVSSLREFVARRARRS